MAAESALRHDDMLADVTRFVCPRMSRNPEPSIPAAAPNAIVPARMLRACFEESLRHQSLPSASSSSRPSSSAATSAYPCLFPSPCESPPITLVPTQTETLLVPEIALIGIGVLQVHVLQRRAGAVEKRLAPHATTHPDGVIEVRRVGPLNRVLANHAPLGIRVKRTSDTGGAGHLPFRVVPRQPADDIGATHRRIAVEDERIPEADPPVGRHAHPTRLVAGDADPLLNQRIWGDWPPRRGPEKLAHLLPNRVELVLPGTLSAHHALAVALNDARIDGHGGPPLAAVLPSTDDRAQHVASEVALRHANDRDTRALGLLLEPRQ